MIKPRALRQGDTIAVISPSWDGPALFPHRVERGKRFLESLGYRIILTPHAFGQRGYVSGTPAERAADINQAFADPNVRAIVASIGGNHACHVLPLLNYALIEKNPKILMGYSDVTVLNVAIHVKTGLVTFNGPTVMVDLGEYPAPPDYTVRSMLATIASAKAPGEIAPAPDWTEETLDWGQKLDLTRPRRYIPSPGWTWLKPGRAGGRLVGGCIESLEHLRGTPYWPDMEDALLFFETSEDAPPPAWVDAVLQDYDNMGVLARIRGLLFGRPMGYTEQQRQELRAVILERTAAYDFPVVADMDFGHTAPLMTLPVGCSALLDSDRRMFAVTEAAVVE